MECLHAFTLLNAKTTKVHECLWRAGKGCQHDRGHDAVPKVADTRNSVREGLQQPGKSGIDLQRTFDPVCDANPRGTRGRIAPQQPVRAPEIAATGCIGLDYERSPARGKGRNDFGRELHIRRLLGILALDSDMPLAASRRQEER